MNAMFGINNFSLIFSSRVCFPEGTIGHVQLLQQLQHRANDPLASFDDDDPLVEDNEPVEDGSEVETPMMLDGPPTGLLLPLCGGEQPQQPLLFQPSSESLRRLVGEAAHR